MGKNLKIFWRSDQRNKITEYIKTLHRQSDITLADFWGIQKITIQ